MHLKMIRILYCLCDGDSPEFNKALLPVVSSLLLHEAFLHLRIFNKRSSDRVLS